jgi:nucleoid DNA-binding protein
MVKEAQQVLDGRFNCRKSNSHCALSLTLVVVALTLGTPAGLLGPARFGVPSHHTGGELKVTKKEIVKTISEEIGMTQLKTKEIVQKTFNAIVETLVEERRIELRNFGVFEVKARAARKARNPRTGQRVDVPEKFVVTFKPGKEMEEKVRELEQRLASQGISLTQDQNSRPAPEPDNASDEDSPSPAMEQPSS